MTTDPISKLRHILWWLIAGSLVIHLLALILDHTVFDHWRWVHHPTHAAAEMSGSVIAFMVAWFLHSLHLRGEGTSYNLIIASALVAMGVLDGLHALEEGGKIFVWLHSTATFAGGAFFILVWLPVSLRAKFTSRWLLAVLLGALSFGIASMAVRDWVPEMVQHGRFTSAARALNVGGGVLMLLAATRLLLTYRAGRNVDDLLFCLQSTLFGAAAIMFEQSVLWDLPWWGWHLLRLMAYVVALWFILLSDLRARMQLETARNQLADLNVLLEERVEERTAELKRRDAESHTIIESIPSGIIIVDQEGCIARVNQAATDLFAYEKGELLGQSIDLLVPDEVRERHPALRMDYSRHPEVRSMGADRELRGRRHDGALIPIEIGLNPIETAEGPQILVSIIDLTERKRAENELKLISNRLLVATQAGRIGVWDYDIVDNSLIWDDEMYRLYGIRPEQFSGAYEAWENGLHPEDLTQEREKLERAIRGEGEFDTEFRVIWPSDGSVHVIKANATVLHNDAGEAVRMIGTNQDVTERRRAEEELLEAKEGAEAANRAKSEFLANMSHEIRTPLNGVIGMTELLLGTRLNQEQREYLGLITSSAESLLEVINDILDFSKIEAGKMTLDPHDFDLRDSLGDTLQTLSFRAAEAGLELVYQVQSDVPDCLVGDLGRIRQILVNLVGNALKFTKEGEVMVDVRLENLTRDQVSLHFLVNDTGIGIPPEKLEAIFESFTQAETSTTRTYGGSGLGLAISKRLVELMKGRIWVESELGRGSSFQFTAQFGVREGESKALRLPAETLHGLPVLIVDDNATNRKILEEMLRSWEMVPQSAADGASALELLIANRNSSHPCKLILLDLMMPGMDGHEVMRRVKKEFGEAAPAILMLTSAGLHGLGERSPEFRPERILTKPVKQSDLLDAITRLFGSFTRDELDHSAHPSRPEHVCPMKVLIAEDGRVNQMVAVRLLEDRGHSTVVASDGRIAVDLFQGESFDAILMDVNMPNMDGFQASAAIRKIEEGTERHIPIIAMTANAMKGDRERCLAAGMDDYVSKPVRSVELFATLEKYGRPFDVQADSRAPGQDAIPLTREAEMDKSVFDAEQLRRDLVDPALMKSLIEIFAEDTSAQLEEARQAIAAQDADALHQAAHSLKGTVGNYATTRALDAARVLDELARQGKLEEAAPQLSRCQEEVAKAHRALQAFRKSLS